MRATVVATPVLERLRAGAAGVVRGATERAAYLDFDGFVVALTAPDVPLMPNGIAVARTLVRDGAVRAAPGRIVLGGGEAVTWSSDAAWEPRLAVVDAGRVDALRERGAAIRAALGGEPSFDADLERALRDRDVDAAARAAGRLIGLGGGLTPEGDDVLAATAAVVVAVAHAVGLAQPDRDRFVAALVPADSAARTTALSATLLALAAEGRIVEPVHRLLDLDGGSEGWRDALATLVATGASTGRAYAGAVAGTLSALASRSGPR